MRRLSTLTLAVLAASGATAGGMTVNSPQLTGMGGAGVSASSALNPALITPVRGEHSFDLTLGAVSLYIEDPNGFASSLQQFLDEDLETYQDFDYGQLNEAAGDLTTAASNTADAAAEFENDPNDDNLDDLRQAQQGQSTATDDTQTSISNYQSLVSDTEQTFRAFSDRPINFGLLTGLGLTMPRGQVPFAVSLSNNTYGGSQLNLEENDLENFNLVLEDLDDYLDQVEELNDRLADLIDAAEAYSAAGYDPTSSEADDFEAASDAFDTQRDVVENFSSSNNLFVNGEVDDDADILTFDEDDLESTIDILGANITELTFGSGMDFPNDYGNLSVGANAKLQLVTVFGEVIEFGGADNVDSSFVSENTNEYLSGNLDIGVAQSFEEPGLGLFSVGAVVKDIIPQSFESGDGREVEIGPKVRAGVSHHTRLTRVTMDIDLTENDPIGFGVPTRYFGIGGEFNAWDWARFRAGYRNNLAVDDSSIVTAGVGLTPWVMEFDVSAWVKPNPDDDFDLLLNSGFSTDLAIRF